MQLRCIRDFSQYRAAHVDEDGSDVPADVVDVPDGAAFDDFHWAPAAAAPPSGDPPADPPAPPAAQFPPAPKEM